MLEAMPAVTPDTRSNGSVTAETALRLRLDIMPGVAVFVLSCLHQCNTGHCCSIAEDSAGMNLKNMSLSLHLCRPCQTTCMECVVCEGWGYPHGGLARRQVTLDNP